MRTPPLAVALATALSLTTLSLTTLAPSIPSATARAHDRTPAASAGWRVDKDVRFSTFNASLNRNLDGELRQDLANSGDAQAANVAETIQRAAPDVVLVNEFDYDEEGLAAKLFRDNYLERSWRGSTPIDYPYYYVAPSNTGVPSGSDLNNDGTVGGPDDALGFGLFPGQYGMVVYSKYPIATDEVRTFQDFLWKDMPGALLPDDPATPDAADWYSPAELDALPLSSKSHWDVPITVARNKTVHFLVSHPTPPTFDGVEDRNGRRNHDEIRFWADYVGNKYRSSYIYDDEGGTGGLHRWEKFVIAGDQNADPFDGDSAEDAILQLLDHPRIDSRQAPTSAGAVEAAVLQGGANVAHVGPAATDTADFNDNPAPGNLRADYVLPKKGLRVLASAVFWPIASDPFYYLTGVFPFPTSDHRLVWIDVKLIHKHKHKHRH